MNCSLCDIEELKEQIIYETDNERVIYNKQAMTEGQCLIYPKRHVNNIRELNLEDFLSLMKTLQEVSIKFSQKLKAQGFNYGFNEGKIAGQHIDHLHIHIIPRYENEIISLLPKPEVTRKLTNEELKLKVKEFSKMLSSK